MVLRNAYVIARNAGGRPTLMHKMIDGTTLTLCGVDVSRWSTSYTLKMISAVMCRRCLNG